MKLKRLLIIISSMVPLAFSGAAYALTVPSDYAQDVQDGNSQVASDQTAKSQQTELNSDENTEGQIDDGDVQVDETVGDQEDDMDDSQRGEAKDSLDSSDKKDTGTSKQGTDKEHGSGSESSTGASN